MSTFPQLATHPGMNPAAVIQGDRWRIGIITESLVRLEWQDNGKFEDHATQMIVNRDWLSDDANGADGANRADGTSNPPKFTKTERDGLLIIDTPALRLTYDMQPFSKEGLSIVVKGVANSQMNTWHYGEAQDGNLRGTARTLDAVDGEIELGLGVISRDGWAVLDDSASNVIVALGNWWSRYHRYTEAEYLELVDRFEQEGLPFTTAVIDMDWHLVDNVDPKYGSGWTGYTWNREFFPDPERFQRILHEHGLRTTLNVHPRDGVRAFEDGYAKVAEHMGIDSAGG